MREMTQALHDKMMEHLSTIITKCTEIIGGCAVTPGLWPRCGAQECTNAAQIRERAAAIQSLLTLDAVPCSICRRTHGPEITHAAE